MKGILLSVTFYSHGRIWEVVQFSGIPSNLANIQIRYDIDCNSQTEIINYDIWHPSANRFSFAFISNLTYTSFRQSFIKPSPTSPIYLLVEAILRHLSKTDL